MKRSKVNRPMNKKHPAREGLFRRLQSGRREPLVHVQRGFGPPCPTNKLVAFDTWRGATGFFSKAFCLFRQTLIWWGGLFETASFHSAAPFR